MVCLVPWYVHVYQWYHYYEYYGTCVRAMVPGTMVPGTMVLYHGTPGRYHGSAMVPLLPWYTCARTRVHTRVPLASQQASTRVPC